jgi:cob(I)alamin adenosyltransferase
MKIYTKTGDGGETGLFRGPRVPKHHLRVQAYGAVDELNAMLGIALCEVYHTEIRDLLTYLQHQLFEVGADLATPPQDKEDGKLRVPASMTEALEKAIDYFDERLPELGQFILPGGNKGAAWLHYSRTVCRRAERGTTLLAEQQPVNPEIIRYLNRLSDLLFVLARAENQSTGVSETIWKKRSL